MCTKEIHIWMVKNRLKLNDNNTELLIIKSRSDLSPVIENIEVSNSTIQPSTSAYKIGVTFDEYMSMNKHITNICKSCFFHFRNIARIKNHPSTSDIQTLVHAFINSLLYGHLSSSLIEYRMFKIVLAGAGDR